LSKASRRSSRTVRGTAGRPAAAGGTTGSPASNPARPPSPDASNPSATPTVDASSLAGRATTGRPAPTRTPAGRPPGSRPAGSRPTASSRPRRTLYQPSFFDRHRTALIGGAAAIIVALVGAFFFFSVTASAYSCGTISQPQPSATPLPNGSPGPLGQAQPDMGNLHIAVGSNQHYAYCPPASGSHYFATDEGPIPAKYYGPDEGTRPEGWIHNLEHGAIVILYNCKMGACDDATLAALQAIPQGFPDSPICGIKAGVLAPVIARFDDMPAPFAALVWDRLLYLNTLDVNEIKQFYATQGELYNPESQCTRPSPGPSAGPSSAPSTAPSTEPSTVPSTAPSSAPASSASPAAS
jgi:hypothetical protein